jgi:hypothetical protein
LSSKQYSIHLILNNSTEEAYIRRKERVTKKGILVSHMNLHTQDHEAGTSTSTTATTTITVNTNATEDELESPSAPPAFDSFGWLAIGLSIAVGTCSAFYFRKSKKQLEGTLETLERNMNS